MSITKNSAAKPTVNHPLFEHTENVPDFFLKAALLRSPASIKSCFFHFVQAYWRNIKKLEMVVD